MTQDPPDGRHLSPQEKKALSYAPDGRNAYGENDKASRRNVPLRKRLVNRANRHSDRQVLSRTEGARDDVAADAGSSGAGEASEVWKKDPDRRLGEYLAQRNRQRKAR